MTLQQGTASQLFEEFVEKQRRVDEATELLRLAHEGVDEAQSELTRTVKKIEEQIGFYLKAEQSFFFRGWTISVDREFGELRLYLDKPFDLAVLEKAIEGGQR